jgi:6-phosphogluconolactonase
VEVVASVPDAFAQLIADRVSKARGGDLSLFCSGGSVAEECYRRLAARSTDLDLDWSGVGIFLGDERCVPPDHPDSNHRMIADTLLGAVGPVASDNPMYRSGTPAEAAAAYQDIISALPAIDVIHLGMGPDGHTASLFPDSESLSIDDPGTLVVATRDPNGNNPHDRISLTFPAIARARLVVFTVAGTSKRDAFSRIVAGADLPAGRVSAQSVVWLVDAEAAGQVPATA